MPSRRRRSSKRKKDLPSAILVVRRDFLQAMRLLSHALEAMGEEFEMFRSDEALDPELRQSAMHIVSAHINNLSHVSAALQMSIYDPIDPNGTKGRDLN